MVVGTSGGVSSPLIVTVVDRRAAALQAGDRALATVLASVGDVPEADLYRGRAGIVVALAQAADLTGHSAYRDAAVEQAELLTMLHGPGLYTGLGGVLVALTMAGHDDRSGTAVAELESASWGETTDVISGAAGVGLALLWAHARSLSDIALSRAVTVGRWLVERAQPAPGGLAWAMSPSVERMMPNFSHGTAGVAYFLAGLAETTGDERFLQAAESGANHLLRIADRTAGRVAVHHQHPGGEDLYYLGWCHGPTGTARLFQRLAASSGDEVWRAATVGCAATLLASGIPERRPAGFWNNYGVCCGDAGVLDFVLALHARTDDPALHELADRLVDSILAAAVPDDVGLSWPHAEMRVRPDEIAAQPGYMHGGAGIAVALLRYATGRAAPALPDSPWT